MRILSVCVAPPSDTAAWWRISRLARILNTAGHEVFFYHYVRRPSFSGFETGIDSADGLQHKYFMVSPLNVHVTHLTATIRGRFDVVLANSHVACFCALLGKLSGPPLLFDMHGSITDEYLLINRNIHGRARFLGGLARCKLIHFADLAISNEVICVSRRMKMSLVSKGFPEDRVSIVTNGVDLDQFQPTRSCDSCRQRDMLGLSDKVVFGYVGFHQKWQGVDEFIEAARGFDDTRATFLVVGSSRQSKEKNIVLVPNVRRPDIAKYYAACDVLVLPRPKDSATEVAAPTKFAEYTAMGKPILTTDVGDAAGYVREYECGVVVPDNRPHSLQAGMREIMNTSPSDLARMGRNSRKLAENEFDWKRIGAELVSVVAKLSVSER